MAIGGGGALIVIVVAIVMALMGKDPSALLEAAGSSGTAPAGSVQPNPGEDRLAAANDDRVALSGMKQVRHHAIRLLGKTSWLACFRLASKPDD